MKPLRFCVLAGTAGLLGCLLLACASGLQRPKPTPLEVVLPQLAGRQLWTQQIGAVGFPLSIAVHGTSITVANDGGTVLSVQADNGRELWRTDLGVPISAGVGSDGRVAAVLTRDNELVALDAGKIIWRQPLMSKLVTAPLVAGERVFVLGMDRAVHAFDAFDGRKLWSYQRPHEALTLSQPGVLQPFKDTLLVGQGARLVGLNPSTGAVRWAPLLATPRGTNEVERLADLIGPAARHADVVCARAFQAAVACINAEHGGVLWSRTARGKIGLAADEQLVLGADTNDRITAWRISDGSVAWAHERLRLRGLTAPLVAPSAQAFVVADSEGMVHWLSRTDGATLLRMPTDGSAIRVHPVRVGAITLVLTRDGGLFAFRAE